MTVRLSPRDMWILQWLSQMSGAPMDIVGALLACWPMQKTKTGVVIRPGRSEINAYRVTARLREAGKLVDELLRPVPGPGWAVPTSGTASLLLDFPVKPWIPGPMMANHLATVARVRLALAKGRVVEDTWVSERVLRHRNGFNTAPGVEMPHIHDGHWTDDLGHLHAIEVELTRKGSADARVTMQAAYDAAKEAGAASLIYYCESAEVRSRVATAAKSLTLAPGTEVRAHSLTNLITPAASGDAGLSAAGGAAS